MGGGWEEEVSEPEREKGREERKWEELSSGVAGNWEGRTRGVPKTASAGDKLDWSWGVDRKEKRHQGK